MSGNYSTALPVPTPLGTINVKRGWASVDATVGGDSFRFVDTHLEAFNSIIRTAQASQLALPGGPLDTRMQVILVGDLNSDPTIAPDQNNPTISDENAYDQFANAGFADRGVSVDTCCHDADLLDAGGQFTERIDHVLTKPPLVQVSNDLTGDDPALRTPFGLWPSDHGGVVSTLRLP
jgi:endonuclease/exonuclease/phosphatase family metal-dependent hydrolase